MPFDFPRRDHYAFVMKPFPGKSIISIVVAAALAGILTLLAWLQFNWVNKVAQAERERMESSLETAIVRFRWDFYSQLLHVCSAFQVDQGGLSKDTLQAYADRYDDWMHASTRPRLVSSLWVWKAQGAAGRRLFRLNPVSGRFESAGWPVELEPLRAHFQQYPARFFRYVGPIGSRQHWNLVEQVPALVRPLWSSAAPGATSLEGYLVIKLNIGYMQNALFPLLTERYFHGPRGLVYRVSIVSKGNPGRLIYQSASYAGRPSGYPPDAVVDLISMDHAGLLASPFSDQLAQGSDVSRPSDLLASLARSQITNGRVPIVVLAGPRPEWQMVVRHPGGSVQAAVVELRHRDLAVSLGVLIVLATGMGLVVVSAQRAQRLARIQLDFVAGVSHELRSPLAVICSAADNLADGVVAGRDQIREYGALIRSEGRHLVEMVEQTLGFAAQQAGRRPADLLPVDVAGAIDLALLQAGLTTDFSDVRVEKHLGPGLLPVMADAPALARCLQNLLVNAVKYGGERRWVRIGAQIAHASKKKPEIKIVVEDKGIGIQPVDLPHIFEPFYRGRSQEVTQIRGTGLGLSLARDIAESIGGTLTVKSEPGKGSAFVLRLPACGATERATPVESTSLLARTPSPSVPILLVEEKGPRSGG
jgi:signal transduction histidine kinase